MQQNRPATAELVDFLQAAHACQADCVDELKRTARAHVRADALVQWAERLKRGEQSRGSRAPPLSRLRLMRGRASRRNRPMLAAEHTVQIGPIRLSPSLYATYLAESSQRLACVEALFTELAAAPERGVPPDLTRHIHSLSGISGTAGFRDVRALAAALERLLELLPRDEIAANAGSSAAERSPPWRRWWRRCARCSCRRRSPSWSPSWS